MHGCVCVCVCIYIERERGEVCLFTYIFFQTAKRDSGYHPSAHAHAPWVSGLATSG